jgi:ankyrin repeat protein
MAAYRRPKSPKYLQTRLIRAIIEGALFLERAATGRMTPMDMTISRLAQAVQADDVEQARAILKARPELVNMDTGNNEHRALHYAVYNRSPEMVRLLMQSGADARKGIWPIREATTALTFAVERGYDEIANIIRDEEQGLPQGTSAATASGHGSHREDAWPAALAEAGQSEDETTFIAALEAHRPVINTFFYSMAPLHVAAYQGWNRAAAWLLEHGADVNGRDDGGGPSPLECALFQHQASSPIVGLLRDAGAEVTPRAAIALGEADTVRRMHAEGKLEGRLPARQGGRSFMEVAVAYSRPEMLTLLFDLGLPLTPNAAVLLGKADWLRKQLAAGTLENPIDYDGGLISFAITHDRSEMLAELLDMGLDPNERTRVENTEDSYASGFPLHHCVRLDKPGMAEMLLTHGADLNAAHSDRGTALYAAYGQKRRAMITLLESHGAFLDAELVGYLGDAELARQMVADEKAGRLKEGVVPRGTTVAEAFIGKGHLELTRMALEHIQWPRDDSRWHWPMLQALTSDDAEGKDLECFLLLLQRAGPNASSHGRTLLHHVMALGPIPGFGKDLTPERRRAFAKPLLDRGARLDIRDDLLKSTPLGWACRWGRAEMVRLLLEHGADPEEADAEPWARPLAWAERMKRVAVLAVLREFGQPRS